MLRAKSVGFFPMLLGVNKRATNGGPVLFWSKKKREMSKDFRTEETSWKIKLGFLVALNSSF